ncbi:GreA/GreB family elongation factor [Paenibacillus xanthanilyticus]|uniref:GreA/GreB family elongation factor n=1 Tax=Paenibacillus xanthanilyticus TaxID=1783531 RepID=A0ABV8K094_9BACL
MNNFEVREYILRQLVHLEESKKTMLDAYFPLPDRHAERKSTEILFGRYVHRIEKLLFCLTHEPDFQLTFVVIDSTVTIRDKRSQVLERYKICYPDKADIDAGCISFLSPLGRQLLLSPIYSTVQVALPGGECEYTVERITVP